MTTDIMTTEIVANLSQIATRYDAVFCDVWGCYHNGQAPMPDAIAALQAFRANGGTVVLLTNAPRPETAVRAQLDAMNAPRDSYDVIASSGAAARDAVRSGDWGKRVYHIGAPKDDPFFENANVERVRLEDAETVVCTGLRDDRTETVDDYVDELREASLRGLRFLCANPDLVVDVGELRLYCAGALAAKYRELGGIVVEYGKPHPQIYDYARKVLTETAGREIPDHRILCIGDGIRTDVKGAMGEDLDCLFVTGGLAAHEVGDSRGDVDPMRLKTYLDSHVMAPRFAIPLLA
ncbi:MAG: TIGR01459 family HAD-type hydrolase [Pikeienuella sp.]